MPGYKLRNLGSGITAADSGPERMDKAFAPIQEQFIAGEVLITGLSNTAKILAENPAIANDVVKGGAKVYSFIQSNVEGFDKLITRGQNSAVYNDVSKSKTSYDSKRNWSEEIDSLVSATGITESRIIDMAFALSAGITGIAGALYAHKIRFISPEQFGVLTSIEMLMMIVIGGLGSLHGAIFGSIFLISLPELIAAVKGYLPEAIANQVGLQPTIFGLILIGFIIFEPEGIYGRWVKIRTYFEAFPFYRKTMFKRQKTYMKSERLS